MEVEIAVFIGVTTVFGEHEIKTKAMTKTLIIFLIFINTLFCKELPNGLRYPRWGGRRDAVRLGKC